MNFRRLRELTCLLLTAVLAVVSGQAPGDEQELCTVTLPSFGVNVIVDPPNQVPLMDSSHYENLLPPRSNPVWQRVDIDGNNEGGRTSTWTEQGSSCITAVLVCGYVVGPQDDWLITQFINRTVDGNRLPQVTVQIEYTQTTCVTDTGTANNCQRVFNLYKYERSSVDPAAARNTINYQFINTLTTRDTTGLSAQNIIQDITFSTEESGFYLAVRDTGTCIVIHRMVVFYYVCPSQTVGLVVRPETIAPRSGVDPLQVASNCVDNASPRSGGSLQLTCLERGTWLTSSASGCVCNDGFIESNDGQHCLPCDPGFYASVAAGMCLVCPENSNSTVQGLAECPCDPGYFRTAEEVDLLCRPVSCGSPPSISNGFPGIPTRTTFGGTVTYSCDAGYELSGSATVTCQASGMWSTGPTCTVVSCGSPPSISNGSPGTPTSTTFGGMVNYTCDTGYVLSGSATVTCQASGMWSTRPTCDLAAMCPVGTYEEELSTKESACVPCPDNSISTVTGSRECTCFNGYYRTEEEGPNFPCSSPSSSCKNLQVFEERTRANTITVRWERPEITGRDDFYYNIFYSEDNQTFTQHNPRPYMKQDTLVDYSLSGLRPLTTYTIRVTAENGVSDQEEGGERRSCQVTGQTGDVRANAPSLVVGFCTNVVWTAPTRSYGRITGYDVRFVSRGSDDSVVISKGSRELFHAIEDELATENMFVQVRAKTSASPGIWSTLVPIGCSVNVFPTCPPCPPFPTCPTCPPVSPCPTCPSVSPCPTCPPFPTFPTCPPVSPCPTCPPVSPCPTCPPVSPCPICPPFPTFPTCPPVATCP